jgi:hypothetical protein
MPCSASRARPPARGPTPSFPGAIVDCHDAVEALHPEEALPLFSLWWRRRLFTRRRAPAGSQTAAGLPPRQLPTSRSARTGSVTVRDARSFSCYSRPYPVPRPSLCHAALRVTCLRSRRKRSRSKSPSRRGVPRRPEVTRSLLRASASDLQVRVRGRARGNLLAEDTTPCWLAMSESPLAAHQAGDNQAGDTSAGEETLLA